MAGASVKIPGTPGVIEAEAARMTAGVSATAKTVSSRSRPARARRRRAMARSRLCLAIKITP
jgi:hypothetical protein